MKKGTVIAIVIVAVIAVLAIAGFGNYNSLVKLQTGVESAAADIDNQLQRRADLIPNLVATVQALSDHEMEVITAITTAREHLAAASSTEEKLNADAELTSALSKLTVLVEDNPGMVAQDGYKGLMDELAGTENRVAYARDQYNEAAKEYNQKIRMFPAVIFARMFGFDAVQYFEASAESATVPSVSFN